jgi:hypothetical protein
MWRGDSGAEQAAEVGVEGLAQEGRPIGRREAQTLDHQAVDHCQQHGRLGLGVGDLREVALGDRGVEEPGEGDPQLVVRGGGDLLEGFRGRGCCRERQPDPGIPRSWLIEWQPEFERLAQYVLGRAGQIDGRELLSNLRVV